MEAAVAITDTDRIADVGYVSYALSPINVLNDSIRNFYRNRKTFAGVMLMMILEGNHNSKALINKKIRFYFPRGIHTRTYARICFHSFPHSTTPGW